MTTQVPHRDTSGTDGRPSRNAEQEANATRDAPLPIGSELCMIFLVRGRSDSRKVTPAADRGHAGVSSTACPRCCLLGDGGWIGLGPGNSRQRNFLPHPYSDFIYAIIIEEYGLIGGAIIMFIYLVFLFRSIRIFKKCPYAFGAFLALGLSFTLAIQAIANMAVTVNLFPVTGVTLPLVSMGGTSFIFTCLAIGIILSVARNVEKQEKEVSESVVS